ncbi:MAG: hypothetical protein DWQ37_16855 [Planctomycetota bacterium]|nr:MAG: hypothetical protein DWQ37_16855 [Planctomycetota bacterium]
MTPGTRALTAALLSTLMLSAAAAETPPQLARWLGPQQWEKDTPGPIVQLGEEGTFDDTHIFAPAVALEDGAYQLWYCGSRGTRHTRVFRLGLATSFNGKQFEKYAHNPVLAFADGKRSVLTPGLLRNADGSVLREDAKLRMWFSATAFGETELHTLHQSTSSDGIHWAKPSPPQLEHVYCPTVLKSDDGYQLWYVDVATRPWKIRYATSGDGRAWDVRAEPVLDFTQDWESGILVYPCVLQADGVYLMWYGSYQADVKQTTAIGFAASLDGITWHKHAQNPVLRPSPDRAWESNYVTSGCVLRMADGSFRYWYASRKAPPFTNLYFAINTARWTGPPPEDATAP